MGPRVYLHEEEIQVKGGNFQILTTHFCIHAEPVVDAEPVVGDVTFYNNTMCMLVLIELIQTHFH